MSTLKKNLGIYAVADLLGGSIAIITSPLVTRLLTEDQYGAFGLLTAVWVVVKLAQYGGMDAAYPMFSAQVSQPAERRRILITATGVATFSLIVVWGLFAAVALLSPWLQDYARVDKVVLAAFLLGLAPASLTYWYLYLLRYMHRAMAFARISLAGRVAAPVLALPVMVLLTQGHRLSAMFVVICAVQALALCWALWEFKRLGTWPYAAGGFDRPLARKMLRYGIVLLPGFAVYAMCSAIDRLLLGWLARDQLHILTLAISLGAVIPMLKRWFGLVWDPHMVDWISTRDPAVYLPRLRFAAVALSLIFFPLAALTAVWSDVVVLLYPASYAPTAPLVPFLALTGAVSVLSLVAVATVVIANSPRFHLPLYTVAVAVNAAVGLWLIPRIGALGAVLGTLAAETFIILAWIAIGALILKNLRLNWLMPAVFAGLSGAFIALYRPGSILPEAVLLERVLVTAGVAAISWLLALAFRPRGGWKSMLGA